MGFTQHLVNAGIGVLGQALRLPEMGFSERIAYGKPAAPQASVNTGQVQGVSAPQPQNYSQNTNNFSPVANTYQKAAQRQQAQSQQRASSGGGGNGFNMNNYKGWNETSARADYNANPNKFANQQGPSQDDIMNQINGLYGESENYLNQAESALRADHPSALAEAEAIFKTNSSMLGTDRDVAFQGLNSQSTKATKAKESALESARRMYADQQMGATQRFGGSSSAGQAASELMAREQARQFGQTGRQHAEVQQQIDVQRQNVEKEFNTGLMQLEQQKQSGISSANRDFQNKLLQIAQNRAEIGQAKAEARLTALQELRNKVFAIEQQNTQFTQQLTMMREQANLQLQSLGQSSQQGVDRATNTVNAFNPNIQSNLTASNNTRQQAPAQQQLTGQIKPGRRQEDYLQPSYNRAEY